jgi:hypothetical protein
MALGTLKHIVVGCAVLDGKQAWNPVVFAVYNQLRNVINFGIRMMKVHAI